MNAPSPPLSAASLSWVDADARTQSALSGRTLHGDDFTLAEIEQWFELERNGYYDLYYKDKTDRSLEQPDIYTYEAVARLHNWHWLPPRHYAHALGIGSADGAELRPVLARSDRVTVLEPSDGFAATVIDGKPVDYVKPEASGRMPFADASFDFVVCFSVLHHIPNVSTILREIGRVLRPGGHVLLREPTHSMGDWRQPRRGLTPLERGIPVPLFRRMIGAAGLEVVRETRCMFSLMPRLEPLLRRPIWTLDWVVRLDAWLCRLPVWADVYHATTLRERLRPTSVAYVLTKPGAAPSVSR